jgi:GMP synthase (glutamine-hydrolysing)
MIGVFRHGIDESAGYLEEVLETSGRLFRVFNLWEDDEVPSNGFSHLILLGGKMSVNDEGEYPFLKKEKQVIRAMIARSRPVLGVCLGAQMIASALGARVYPCEKEVGWSPVTWIDPSPGIPADSMVFQWHGETFDLPDGAQLICRGELVENQAFIRDSALGVQFHIEVTNEMIRKWTADRDDRASLTRDTERYIQGSRQLCNRITVAFIGGDFLYAR